MLAGLFCILGKCPVRKKLSLLSWEGEIEVQPMETTAIQIEHLTVSYPKNGKTSPVLSDVSLAVPSGTVCAVIGPSGCGKSTLLKVAAGLVKDYEGKVSLGGMPLDARKMTIGFMPQSYGLLPWRTVAENIRLGRKVRGIWQPGDEDRLRALSSRLGLEGLLDRYPHELSGGQQQRVSLARVFLLQPDVLLMDEPFSALDAITREEMQDVFRELWQQESITTILVTHYVEEALYLGGLIAVMGEDGRISQLLDNPAGDVPMSRSDERFFQLGRQLRQKLRPRQLGRGGGGA